MISVSHVFASLSLSSLVFKMGRVTSHWLAAGGEALEGASEGPLGRGEDPSCPDAPGHRRQQRGCRREGCRVGCGVDKVGALGGELPLPSPLPRSSGPARCSSGVPEPHQPYGFLEYLSRPQPLGSSQPEPSGSPK